MSSQKYKRKKLKTRLNGLKIGQLNQREIVKLQQKKLQNKRFLTGFANIFEMSSMKP